MEGASTMSNDAATVKETLGSPQTELERAVSLNSNNALPDSGIDQNPKNSDIIGSESEKDGEIKPKNRCINKDRTPSHNTRMTPARKQRPTLLQKVHERISYFSFNL